MHARLILHSSIALVAALAVAPGMALGAPSGRAATAQDTGTALPPPPPSLPPSAPLSPLLDVDGQTVVPGALPKSTSPAAREAWQRTCKASLGAGDKRPPITAFDLSVDLRYKATDARTNDFKARYRFLAPAFVRATTENRREQLRGPAGDFLIDPERKEKIPLVGRESAEDRRQLDETLSIARNFTAISDPASISIVSLSVSSAPPRAYPVKFEKRVRELVWLDLVSPNFHLKATKPRAAGEPPPLFRAMLGTDATTGVIQYVLIGEERPGSELDPGAVFLELSKYKPADGYSVPRAIMSYSIDPETRPLSFRVEPTTDLALESVNLRAVLAPEDFLP